MTSASPVSTGDTAYDEATLEAKTKAQLIDLASELGVEGISSKSLKSDIIASILQTER